MDKIKDRRVLISIPAKAMLDEYILTQKAKNAGVPGYMTSRNAVVSDIITKFIEGTKQKEPITLAADTH